MKLTAFSLRSAREILRDPMTVAFSLGFPIMLLLMFTAMAANVPFDLFNIENITPGLAVFGLSFMTLFSATLIARDRESALLQRLYTTPLTAGDFIFGYALPMIPIALGQSAVCYLTAVLLGLPVTIHILYAAAAIAPISLLYIALGLLFGSILNVKQVGGICGALLTNVSAMLSGIWFDLEAAGSGFKKAADLLPFVHAVELERGILNGQLSGLLPHALWVLGYAAAVIALAVLLFLRQMKRQ